MWHFNIQIYVYTVTFLYKLAQTWTLFNKDFKNWSFIFEVRIGVLEREIILLNYDTYFTL